MPSHYTAIPTQPPHSPISSPQMLLSSLSFTTFRKCQCTHLLKRIFAWQHHFVWQNYCKREMSTSEIIDRKHGTRNTVWKYYDSQSPSTTHRQRLSSHNSIIEFFALRGATAAFNPNIAGLPSQTPLSKPYSVKSQSPPCHHPHTTLYYTLITTTMKDSRLNVLRVPLPGARPLFLNK